MTSASAPSASSATRSCARSARDPDYIDDPILLEYLQSVWQPLVAEARARGNIAADIDPRFAWEPFLVRDPSVNAFALPGGYIGVHLGLIAITATRDELASVLAHELSHITQRHIARSIASSKRQSLLSLAALVARRARGEPQPAAPTPPTPSIAGTRRRRSQGQLNFSRDMEREADRVGFAVMTGAGFAPGGMAAMFEKLDKGSRLNDSGSFPYLRSHPLTTERIGEARARLGTGADAWPPVSVLEHTVAEARARVLMDPRLDALRRWQALDARHGGVDDLADKLLSAYSKRARVDACCATGRGPMPRSPARWRWCAVRRLRRARAERAVLLLQAESLLARGAAPRATQVLQPYAGENRAPGRAARMAQITLAPSFNADETALTAARRRAADVGRGAPERCRRLDDARPGLGAPRPAAARAARRGRVARRARRPDRRGRPAARRPAARARGGGAVDFIDVSVIDARLRDIEAQRKAIAADERAQR